MDIRIIKQIGLDNSCNYLVECLCGCGKTFTTRMTKISCGCLSKKRKRFNLEKKKIGYYRVLKYDKTENRTAFWICQCVCGKIQSVSARSLNKATPTYSCGCMRNKHRIKNAKKMVTIMTQKPIKQVIKGTYIDEETGFLVKVY